MNVRPAPIAAAAIIVVCTYAISPNFIRYEGGLQTSPYAGDFLHEWVGGYIVRAGDRSRLYDLSYARALQHDPDLVGFEFREDRFLPMVYPPAYYLLVSPFSRLPFAAAAWVWAALSVSCLVATIALLRRAIHPGGVLAPLVTGGDATTDRQWEAGIGVQDRAVLNVAAGANLNALIVTA